MNDYGAFLPQAFLACFGLKLLQICKKALIRHFQIERTRRAGGERPTHHGEGVRRLGEREGQDLATVEQLDCFGNVFHVLNAAVVYLYEKGASFTAFLPASSALKKSLR